MSAARRTTCPHGHPVFRQRHQNPGGSPHSHQQQGQRRRHILQAGTLIGPLYFSFGLILDPGQENPKTSRVVYDFVMSVLNEKDETDQLVRYFDSGKTFLELWSGERAKDCGHFPMTTMPVWKPQLESRVFIVPDPDAPAESTFISCQLLFRDRNGSFVEMEDNHRALVRDMMRGFKQEAKKHRARRGAITILQGGGVTMVYWDGKRFIEYEALDFKPTVLQEINRRKALARGEIEKTSSRDKS